MNPSSLPERATRPKNDWRAIAGTRAFAFWAFLALLYSQLALSLMPTWSDGTYYDYGWLALFVVPFFFMVRWRETDPGAAELDERLRRLAVSLPVMALVGGCLLVITLLRMAQWADSSWRPPLVFHGLIVLGLTAVLLFRIQGRSIAAYWGCAVVVLLVIPLPMKFEFSLIHWLTEGVMEFALFVNRMLGLPLASQGETIFANGIPLQVSDGCSGIRSFQSGIFAGFVLGEFLRISLPSRLVLLLSGFGIAFLMNGCRVIYLVRHAVAHPGADLEKVHDMSGYVSLTTTFLLITAVGWLLARIDERLKGSGADHFAPS
jgi:exosortase/archaeosortase family protein